MTTIVYKIKSGFGVITEFRHGDPTVAFYAGHETGTLKIGGISAEVRSGRATVNLSPLPDGIYTPMLFTKSGEIQLEGIRKLGEKLTRYGTDRNLIMNMLQRIDRLEEKCETLCTLVSELDKKVCGNGIFG